EVLADLGLAVDHLAMAEDAALVEDLADFRRRGEERVELRIAEGGECAAGGGEEDDGAAKGARGCHGAFAWSSRLGASASCREMASRSCPESGPRRFSSSMNSTSKAFSPSFVRSA